jgi:hypothetical protein
MGLAVLFGFQMFSGITSPAREVFGGMCLLYGGVRLFIEIKKYQRQQHEQE